jgi:hypothetical protein
MRLLPRIGGIAGSAPPDPVGEDRGRDEGESEAERESEQRLLLERRPPTNPRSAMNEAEVIAA